MEEGSKMQCEFRTEKVEKWEMEATPGRGVFWSVGMWLNLVIILSTI